ncbi:MAG: DsbA family protein [Candidatus Diapherotrites archaeon]|nr:DsbA family protein [Candidatus Diapherotrites archaeon]
MKKVGEIVLKKVVVMSLFSLAVVLLLASVLSVAGILPVGSAGVQNSQSIGHIASSNGSAPSTSAANLAIATGSEPSKQVNCRGGTLPGQAKGISASPVPPIAGGQSTPSGQAAVVSGAVVVPAQQPVSAVAAVQQNPDAKVKIVEFGDLQCFFTKKFFNETFLEFKKKFVDTGKVSFSYKDFPIHEFSDRYAGAGKCAEAQGKRWEFMQALFSQPPKPDSEHDHSAKQFDPKPVFDAAQSSGLDGKAFSDCFNAGTFSLAVKADEKEAYDLNLNATPTFFINGEKVVGAKTLAEFEAVVQSKLSGESN